MNLKRNLLTSVYNFMKDFSKKIVEIIKENHIEPKSKISLNWKNYLFWLVFIFIIILGALFFSLIILNVADLGPELFYHLEVRKFIFLIFQTMPYLWMILLLIAIFSGFMVFRKTKKGYRYNILFISSVVVLAIFFFGFIVHFLKFNNRIERNFPGPRHLIHPMESRWQRPEDGLLGGVIVEVDDRLFFLKTPNGEEWKIFYSEETEFGRDVKIESGKMVGVIGEKKQEKEIKAFVIISLPLRDFIDSKMPHCLEDGYSCPRMEK